MGADYTGELINKAAVNREKCCFAAALRGGCIVGRKQEVKELNRLYARNKAELVAIYGRRRVGETYV